MPWTCPACSLAIRHAERESAPRPGVIYRCHICRFELILDRRPQAELAPLKEDADR